MDILVAFSIFTSILSIILLFAVVNLMKKTEKYEDALLDQTKYLQNISNTIGKSQDHLRSLDDRGVFESDDEVGEFFRAIKEIQQELDTYMLPENYGKEKIEQ